MQRVPQEEEGRGGGAEQGVNTCTLYVLLRLLVHWEPISTISSWAFRCTYFHYIRTYRDTYALFAGASGVYTCVRAPSTCTCTDMQETARKHEGGPLARYSRHAWITLISIRSMTPPFPFIYVSRWPPRSTRFFGRLCVLPRWHLPRCNVLNGPLRRFDICKRRCLKGRPQMKHKLITSNCSRFVSPAAFLYRRQLRGSSFFTAFSAAWGLCLSRYLLASTVVTVSYVIRRHSRFSDNDYYSDYIRSNMRLAYKYAVVRQMDLSHIMLKFWFVF